MHYVYILVSDRTQRTYTGKSNNIDRRISEHNSSSNTAWTRQYAPWRLDACMMCDNEQTANVVERYFKSGAGREKFSRFVEANPNHPHPKQGLFDSLQVGRGFGSEENRFMVVLNEGRKVFKLVNS